jgi:hypothetical protein
MVVWRKRIAGAAKGLAAIAVVAVAPGFAGFDRGVAAESRDKVRLMVLDYCVFDEWKKRQVTDKIADECKCASARFAKQIPEELIKDFKDKPGKVTAPAWAEATKACFNSPTLAAPKPPKSG